jgi:hypothetical protein
VRKCPQCQRVQPIEDFAYDVSKSSGRKSLCKSCDRNKSRRYYLANRERVLARVKAQQRKLKEGGE